MIVHGKYPPTSCVAPTGEQWTEIRSRLVTKRTKVLTANIFDDVTFEERFPMYDPQRNDFAL